MSQINLVAFAKDLLEEVFDRYDLESDEICKLGEKHGLLRQVEFDPVRHPDVEADDGEMIYVPSEEWKAMKAGTK